MNTLPSGQQQRLVLDYDPHRTADLAAGHAISPDQFGGSVGPEQIDPGVTVTEDVDMRRLVIVDEDDHAQAVGTQDGDHAAK
jgi:hypothetical protein